MLFNVPSFYYYFLFLHFMSSCELLRLVWKLNDVKKCLLVMLEIEKTPDIMEIWPGQLLPFVQTLYQSIILTLTLCNSSTLNSTTPSWHLHNIMLLIPWNKFSFYHHAPVISLFPLNHSPSTLNLVLPPPGIFPCIPACMLSLTPSLDLFYSLFL